jgi:hypothetical protein
LTKRTGVSNKTIHHPLPEQSSFQFLNEYFRTIDRLFSKKVKGKESFCKTTGLGLKWLTRMEEWDVISAVEQDVTPVYSQDDVIIGKLVVENDSLKALKKSDYKQP